MSERQKLLESIAQTTNDYRLGEIEAPSSEHVDKWISQFSVDVQLPLLRELDYVLKQTYLSKKRVIDFLEGLVTMNRLAGSDPCDFWMKASFLNIQQHGDSQRELLTVFDDVLKDKCGFTTAECGATGGDFIYLDDVMFSGNRVGNDLETWIAKDAPAEAIIHVVVLAMHTKGRHDVNNKLETKITSLGKKIEIKYWCLDTIENRKSLKNGSEVLWPVVLPDDPDLKAYLNLPHRFPFEYRLASGKLGPFSSEKGRQLLELELLRAGIKIRDASEKPKEILRPLGFSPFGFGFGSMIVTFRNCPNTCPLALWWGDPDADSTSPLSKWYPLFRRKTYSDELLMPSFWNGSRDIKQRPK